MVFSLFGGRQEGTKADEAHGCPQVRNQNAASFGLDERQTSWIRRFRRRHGRLPTVLHIGNIGNNAYILAKALNACHVESDVLCYGDYYMMSSPEWEDAEIDQAPRNPFWPAWDEVHPRNFVRPPWFVQGPLDTCLQYLRARRTGHESARVLWRLLELERTVLCTVMRKEPVSPEVEEERARLSAAQHGMESDTPLSNVNWFSRIWNRPTARSEARQCMQDRVRELQECFQRAFPTRIDPLDASDFTCIFSTLDNWRDTLRHYDLVVGYSTDGKYPLVASRRYFAFEHGTIRSIPFETTSEGRLCALTYRLADYSFITNADNIVAAERLGLRNFQFVPHPLQDLQPLNTDEVKALRAELCRRLGADFLVFHPSRQHWTTERHPSWEKGNDFFIDGFARFIHDTRAKAGAVFVNWGHTVEASRALLAKREVADRVLWIDPQPNRRLLSYIMATDVLADQFYLGAFGGTMPKALMLGRPSLIYIDEAQHRWCLPEMPPVVNARTPEQVFQGLCRLYSDKDFVRNLSAASIRWYRRYHSIDVVVGRFLDALQKAVG
jgi:hypothetical protein